MEEPMVEFLMKPKVDFAFKEIMMDEKARIGFLSAVLKIDPTQIKETKILNTYLQRYMRRINKASSMCEFP